jgi:hypothetical protein
MIVAPNDAKAYDKVLKLTKKEPETVTLDLDWASAKTPEGERRGGRTSRGSSRGSDRPERGERTERPERTERAERPSRSRNSARAEAASPEVEVAEVVVAPEAPVVDVPREPRRVAEARVRPIRGVQEAAPRDSDDGRSVVGFGNDVPAFLARPVPMPPASRKSASNSEN